MPPAVLLVLTAIVAAPSDAVSDLTVFPEGAGDAAAAAVTPLAPTEVFARRTCGGARATIAGTDGDDDIEGTNRPDVIVALGGEDEIDGQAGEDRICAGSGEDNVLGGRGSDALAGGCVARRTGSGRGIPAATGTTPLLTLALDARYARSANGPN